MRARVADDFEVRPDMTPMIDCVFLMIVFFICLDFRTLEAKLPTRLPKDTGVQVNIVAPLPVLPVAIEVAVAGERRPLGLAVPGRPQRQQVTGHVVRWRVGPVPVGDETALARELQRIRADRANWVDDPAKPGQRRPMAVVVEPRAGTYYSDVTATVDAVRAAGFEDVTFAAGERRR